MKDYGIDWTVSVNTLANQSILEQIEQWSRDRWIEEENMLCSCCVIEPCFSVTEYMKDKYEERTIANALFQGHDQNFLFLRFNDENIRRLLECMKQALVKVGGHQMMKGSEMIEWVEQTSCYHFTRSDAQALLQRIYTCQTDCKYCYIIPVPYSAIASEQFSENDYYQLIEMDHPKHHLDGVINVKAFEPKVNVSMIMNGYDGSSTLKIVREVETVMSELLRAPYVVDNMYINYTLISTSDVFDRLRSVAERLRFIDIQSLEKEKISFFINVYNMMAIHALIVRGCSDDADSRLKFMHSDIYYIGRYKLSLHDIYHCIMRGKDPPDFKYYLKNYRTNVEFDPRTHFILADGRLMNAIPRVVTIETLDDTLEAAANLFINNNVQFHEVEKRVVMHPVFREFRQDFCGDRIHSELGCLVYISRFLNDTKWETLWRLLQLQNITKQNIPNHLRQFLKTETKRDEIKPIDLGFEINYMESSYQSNRVTTVSKRQSMTELRPIIDIPYDEVIQRDDLRKIFAMFCKNEYSSENILFYEDVHRYVAESKEKRAGFAKMMFEKYLNPPHSPFEVNVSRVLIRKISDLLQAPEESDWADDVFERLMHEVSHVLIDSYSRFRSSELYSMMVDILLKQYERDPENSLLGKIKEQQRLFEEDQQRKIESRTLQRKQTARLLIDKLKSEEFSSSPPKGDGFTLWQKDVFEKSMPKSPRSPTLPSKLGRGGEYNTSIAEKKDPLSSTPQKQVASTLASRVAVFNGGNNS